MLEMDEKHGTFLFEGRFPIISHKQCKMGRGNSYFSSFLSKRKMKTAAFPSQSSSFFFTFFELESIRKKRIVSKALISRDCMPSLCPRKKAKKAKEDGEEGGGDEGIKRPPGSKGERYKAIIVLLARPLPAEDMTGYKISLHLVGISV